MFLFFSVARSTSSCQVERAYQAEQEDADDSVEVMPEEKMPTDKLVDVSPLALRMSSPFNANYWLTT